MCTLPIDFFRGICYNEIRTATPICGPLKKKFPFRILIPKGVLLCSRHHPSLLQRNGTGSHLYTANLHTLRWTSSGVVLLTLVGQPLRLATPSFHYYYSTLGAICQGFFKFFSNQIKFFSQCKTLRLFQVYTFLRPRCS